VASIMTAQIQMHTCSHIHSTYVHTYSLRVGECYVIWCMHTHKCVGETWWHHLQCGMEESSSTFLWACLNTCTKLHGVTIWKTLSFHCMLYLLKQLKICFGTLAANTGNISFSNFTLRKSKINSNSRKY